MGAAGMLRRVGVVRRSARVWASALLVAACGLAMIRVADAAGSPANAKPPSIAGTAKGGLRLEASKGIRRGHKPEIAGVADDGQLLSVSEGTWKGAPPLSFAYQWEECGASVHGCSAISGATASSYRVASPQIGLKLKATVTATNAGGSASATSRATKKIAPGPPVSIEPPAITGSLLEGATLTAGVGAWAGTAPFEFTYQWQRCSILGGYCEDIPGATSSSYTLGALDIASQLAVVVTATNAHGSASATSAETSPILALLPSNAGLPSISGLLQDGQLLSVLAGSWSGSLPISYSYQWQLCNPLGNECADISGANGASLALSPSDIGGSLDVVVTATNVAGSASATTPVTGLIAGLLPSNLSLPSISGLLQEGQLLSVGTGSWSGTSPISYSYQWQLCNALGKECSNISEATGSSLKLLPSEIGSTLDVVVKATNVAGSTSVTTAVTGLIAGILPSNAGLPAISGLFQEGQLLSVGTGSWSGTTPITYSYQWQLCNALGKSCADISEATGSSLKLSPADIGDTLDVVVKATNVAGSSSVTTPVTGLIEGILPANTVLPAISGLLKVGQLLGASTGTWSGTTPITYTYQWELCNLGGGGCSNIAKATSSSFLLSLLDLGLPLRVAVTASNVAGSTSATSNATGLIEGLL
jgi:hypothetical protein